MHVLSGGFLFLVFVMVLTGSPSLASNSRRSLIVNSKEGLVTTQIFAISILGAVNVIGLVSREGGQ